MDKDFDRCHPARIRMGAEIRYFKALASAIAGGKPFEFLVTEADGSPLKAYRYQPNVNAKPGGNPCDDYALLPPSASGTADTTKVPDLLICVLGLHNDLLQEHTRLVSAVQSSGGYPFPFAKEPSEWHRDIFWSNTNQPVWEKGKFPLAFHWHMEPYWPTCKEGYSLSITDMHDIVPGAKCLSVYVAEALGGLIKRKYTVKDLVRPSNYDPAKILASKSQFAGFMYRNCGFFLDSIVRTWFFELLSREYKKVLPMSDCMSFTRTPAEKQAMVKIAQDAHNSFNGDFYVGMDEAAALFRPFKFAFAMDNSEAKGAMSEKLMNAYFGDSIPIFFGGVDIPDMLNQKAFVYCNITYEHRWEDSMWKMMNKKTGWISPHGAMSHDEMVRANEEHNLTMVRVEHLLKVKEMRDSAMPCIKRIMELDKDDRLYKEALAEPLVKNGKVRA